MDIYWKGTTDTVAGPRGFPMIKSNEIQELTICWTTIEFA